MTRDQLLNALLLRIEHSRRLLADECDESGAQLTYGRRCELHDLMACDIAEARALATPMTWPAELAS